MNHRIGTIRRSTGATQYYLSLTPGAWKTFGTEDQSFWCCTGTGVEEYAKLNDSIYWRDAAGVFVNLFIPSELDWAEKGLQLRQETGYPAAEATTITVVAAPAAALAVRVRIPGWLQAAPTVKLNGRPLEASAEPGSYLTLNRTWKAGDAIDVALPMHLHVEALPDEPQTQAFLYGPLVLAGDFGGEGLTEAHLAGPNLRVGPARCASVRPSPPKPRPGKRRSRKKLHRLRLVGQCLDVQVHRQRHVDRLPGLPRPVQREVAAWLGHRLERAAVELDRGPPAGLSDPQRQRRGRRGEAMVVASATG